MQISSVYACTHTHTHTHTHKYTYMHTSHTENNRATPQENKILEERVLKFCNSEYKSRKCYKDFRLSNGN